EYGMWEVLRRGQGLAILATGTMVLPAAEAAQRLEAEGIQASVVNCRFIKPIDEATLAWVIENHSAILTVEEGVALNGFGASVARQVEAARRQHPGLLLDVLGVPDRIIEHANRADQLAECGLDVAGIAARARALAVAGVVPAARTA